MRSNIVIGPRHGDEKKDRSRGRRDADLEKSSASSANRRDLARYGRIAQCPRDRGDRRAAPGAIREVRERSGARDGIERTFGQRRYGIVIEASRSRLRVPWDCVAQQAFRIRRSGHAQ